MQFTDDTLPLREHFLIARLWDAIYPKHFESSLKTEKLNAAMSLEDLLCSSLISMILCIEDYVNTTYLAMQFTDDTLPLRKHFLNARLRVAIYRKLIESSLKTEKLNAAMSLEDSLREICSEYYVNFCCIRFLMVIRAKLIMKESCIKKNGWWTGSKPDVVNGQSPPVSATTQAFRASFAKLQLAINPDDIIAQLYAEHFISPSDKDAASTTTIPSMVRTLLLLNAVERAIVMDHSNFEKFLNILGRIAKYQPLVADIRNNIRSN